MKGGASLRNAVLTENDDDFVPMRLRTLTTIDWKISKYAGVEYGELYDRKNDPDELVNLWNDSSFYGVRSELLSTLADHLICSMDASNGRGQVPSPDIPKILPLKN